MSKWRWLNVKQIGAKPCPRSGISCTNVQGTNRVIFFGGVQDNDLSIDDDSDEEDGKLGNFFNDIFSVNVENERATWTKLELTGKKEAGAKKPRRKEKVDGNDESQATSDIQDEEVQDNGVQEKGITKTVEEGAFTITSTVGLDVDDKTKDNESILETKFSQMNLLKGPSPRFGSHLAIKQGLLYLFGGVVEDDNDRQLTHKDLYSLGTNFRTVFFRDILYVFYTDIHKLDEWETIIESDIKTMEWVDSESSEDDDSDSDDEMDTSQ